MANELNTTRRLLGSSAVVSQNPDERDITVSLDLAGFVRRLLLFDTYILYSVRLKEIPELVRHFGVSGALTLLSSGALEIRCECAQFTEGQFNTPPCPGLTYQFHVIEAHVWEQYLIDNLSELAKAPGLTTTELMALQSAVVRAVKRVDNRQMFAGDVGPAFERELLHNEQLVKAAVVHVLSRDHKVQNTDFHITLHKVGDDRYTAETDLEAKLPGLGADVVHNSIKVALLGISGLCLRIGEMKAHNALSGFTDEELPLFRNKCDSLADAIAPRKQEKDFQRVLSISGLADIAPSERIDVEKLLKIRTEPETLEFRAWLADVGNLTNAEIKKHVAGLNAMMGLRVHTTTGKALRFLTITVAGLYSVPLGTALGALDQFLLDTFFKRSGPAAFVNELYPSVFRTG